MFCRKILDRRGVKLFELLGRIVSAKYRPVNVFELSGRKISGKSGKEKLLKQWSWNIFNSRSDGLHVLSGRKISAKFGPGKSH